MCKPEMGDMQLREQRNSGATGLPLGVRKRECGPGASHGMSGLVSRGHDRLVWLTCVGASQRGL